MRRAAIVVLLAAGCSRDPSPAASAPAAAPAPPPAAAVRPSTPAAGEPSWGEPDMAKIRKLFQQRSAEVKRCYETALVSDEGARGRVLLRFTIREDGALADVAAAQSTFRRRDVPECVADVVRRWRTPFRPAEPVAVEYPLRFSPR